MKLHEPIPLRRGKAGLLRDCYVYILASITRTLYIGVTNNLEHRVYQHRQPDPTSFTSRYNVTRLVYCEAFASPLDAITREKQLKIWRREKKLALIESTNPDWLDLSEGWFD
jgi:putative endonuclease